jgi:hypothetical protein
VNYKLVSGPFAGEVVAEGCRILDLPFEDLDEDLQGRILDWAELYGPFPDSEAAKAAYEASWDSQEVDTAETMRPVSEWSSERPDPGDRPDILLAQDRSLSQIRDTQERERLDAMDRLNAAQEWGTSEDAKPITQIVKEMIQRKCWGKLVLKRHVIWDVETISEAVTEACIALGLGDEEFSPSLHDQGCEIQITLVG